MLVEKVHKLRLSAYLKYTYGRVYYYNRGYFAAPFLNSVFICINSQLPQPRYFNTKSVICGRLVTFFCVYQKQHGCDKNKLCQVSLLVGTQAVGYFSSFLYLAEETRFVQRHSQRSNNNFFPVFT